MPSIGKNYTVQHAHYIDMILKGAKPTDQITCAAKTAPMNH